MISKTYQELCGGVVGLRHVSGDSGNDTLERVLTLRLLLLLLVVVGFTLRVLLARRRSHKPILLARSDRVRLQ
jgi:hypothetical protein